MISLEKWKILTPLQKLPKNVGDLGTLIVAKGFKSCPKSSKSPNMVTLFVIKDRDLISNRPWVQIRLGGYFITLFFLIISSVEKTENKQKGEFSMFWKNLRFENYNSFF